MQEQTGKLELTSESEPKPLREPNGRLLAGQHSLNPSGRPKGRSFTKALTEVLEERGPEGLREILRAQLNTVAEGKPGSEGMFKHLWDRHEGPVTQQIEAVGDMRTLLVLESLDQAEPAMPEGLFASEDVKQLEAVDAEFEVIEEEQGD